jgi:glutaredoxin
MSIGNRVTVTLYTRKGCHLCEDAKDEIRAAARRIRFDYEEFDIDAYPELRQLYDTEVPVVAIDGRKAFKFRLTADDLVRRLNARHA